MNKASIFVDLDSLNVLFKVGSRFTMALSYASGLDRLGETLPGLGSGFDIYLCMKPRMPGEGDLVIDELSITGMPFTVDTEELYTVLKFFRGYNGFGEVYLCNWVHNYIQTARVKTFKSAVYYGNRIAYLVVKDGTLESCKMFGSQREFEEFVGPDYNGYGDVGLIDVDGFRAQYPEFQEGLKPQITAIAPLAQCYRTSVRISTGELLERLTESRNTGVPLQNTYKEREPVEVEPVEDPNLKPVERPKKKVEKVEEPEEVEEQNDLPEVKGRTPFIAVVMLVLSIMLSLALGGFAGIVIKDPGIPDNQAYYNQVEERSSKIQEMNSVYRDAPSFISDVQVAWQFCHASGLPVTMNGISHEGDEFVVRYSCVSENDGQAFVDHIASKYAVASTNDLGKTESGEQVIHQFSVTFG